VPLSSNVLVFVRPKALILTASEFFSMFTHFDIKRMSKSLHSAVILSVCDFFDVSSISHQTGDFSTAPAKTVILSAAPSRSNA
jgi:hypothetical protein